MSKSVVETLLFASMAINAALLIFFAGIFRRIINALDVATFKSVMDLLVRHSSKSPFMIIALNIPLFIAIPYFYFFGFHNRYFIMGALLWLISGSIAKAYKLPSYKKVSKLDNGDAGNLNEERKKINTVNLVQASFYSIALFIMYFGLR